MPKTIVMETRFAGHTIGFAREMAQAFAKTGSPTHLALNGFARDRPELAADETGAKDLGIHWLDPFKPDFASVEQGERELQILTRLAADHAPDRLVVPTGDAIARAVALSAQARTLEARLPRMDIVIHHVAAAYLPTGRSTWKRWRRGLRELGQLRRHRLLTCDAYIGLGSGQWGLRPSGARMEYLPHILGKRSPFDTAQARAHFDLPDDRQVLVSIGDVAHRKGIDRLIAAAAHPDWPENVLLLLAGPVSSKIRPELEAVQAALPRRIRVIDRFLTDDEFATAFVAADLIWAVTPSNLGVSSTFLYAARHGKTAIVAENHRSARWMCNRIGPGIPTTLDPQPICRAVTQALNAPGQTPGQADFLKQITDTKTYDRICVA